MKQRILCEICLKLSELEIPYKIKEESTIYASEEFYDVGLGAELKKVQYDLTVLVDEDKKSVCLYVSTVDESLLPGQPGTVPAKPVSMFRKVKRVTVDKDGQSTVTTVDLGAVPNTVKDTAFRYGWKFSTSLNLNKPARKEPEPPKPVQTGFDAGVGFAEVDFTADDLEILAELENAPPAQPKHRKSGTSFLGRMFGSKSPRHRGRNHD